MRGLEEQQNLTFWSSRGSGLEAFPSLGFRVWGLGDLGFGGVLWLLGGFRGHGSPLGLGFRV